MSIRGRPVRFVVAVLGGWTALRVTMLLSFAPAVAPAKIAVPRRPDVRRVAAETFAGRGIAEPLSTRPFTSRAAAKSPSQKLGADYNQGVPAGNPPWTEERPAFLTDQRQAEAFASRPSDPLAEFAPGTGLSATQAGLPPPNQTDRWSAAAWLLWREEDHAPSYARGPRLGASQVGVRVDYALAPGSALRPAIYARASSALDAPAAAEIAGGIAIHPPLRLPITLAVERRASLSPGGRDAFALLAAGGIYPTEIGHGFRLDAYAQAGMVGFSRRDGFADGRVTVEHPLTAAHDVALGAAIWGSVQPDVSRLDIGPQASVRLHAGRTTLRLGAEWRERVAGNAAPASGPALSLGTDF